MSPVITLADAIRGLVGEKRALGYKYVSEERALARFELFCAGAFPGLETVTRASVEAWIATARRRAVKPATLQSLAAPVRELARWLHRRGVDAYVLPAGVLEKPARYVPHIYSDRELAALFAATDRCHYCPEVPFRHLVMPVLFRTIYACGLRCSEARLLRVADVEIDTGVLQIRDAKGGICCLQHMPPYVALGTMLPSVLSGRRLLGFRLVGATYFGPVRGSRGVQQRVGCSVAIGPWCSAVSRGRALVA